jgi:hypothetical protein
MGQARVKKRVTISSPQRALTVSKGIEDHQCPWLPGTLADGGQQQAGILKRRSGPGVEDVGARVGRWPAVRVALEAHEDDPVELLAAAQQGGHEGIHRATVVELPDDVVPPEQPTESSIERGDPRGHGIRIGHDKWH